jgi:hypothetical protein
MSRSGSQPTGEEVGMTVQLIAQVKMTDAHRVVPALLRLPVSLHT